MKNCPFCKKEVEEKAIKCTHCKQQLVEQVRYIKPKPVVTPKSQSTRSLLRTKLSLNIIKKIAKSKFLWTIVGIIIVIYIFSGTDQTVTNQSVSNINTDIPTQNTFVPKTIDPNLVQPIPYMVAKRLSPLIYPCKLITATPFARSAYLDGSGQLTIKNGTSLDAIAKLVYLTGNKPLYSVYTAYISAGETYVMNHVGDGSYKLVFALGNGWDTDICNFSSNRGSEAFDDSFDFTTTETDQYVEYAKYTVTLNPVIGGTATTHDINMQDFSSY